MSLYVSPTQAPFRLSQSNSTYITQLAVSGKGRTLPIAIGLAIAANRLVSLPGGVIESPEEYFFQQNGENAADAINLVNELVPVDFRTAISVAKDLFLVRYELAYKPFEAFGAHRDKGLASIFGLNAHIPEDILQCMRDHGWEITAASERFCEIICELKKA